MRRIDMADLRWNPLITDLRRMGERYDDRVVPAPVPGDDLVPVERYFDLDYLEYAIRLIVRSAFHSSPGHEPDTDFRLGVVASRFLRHFMGGPTIAAMVGLVRGVGVDLSRTAGYLRGVWAHYPWRVVLPPYEANVGCAERPTAWPAPDITVDTVAELRAHVWRKLYGELLAPLFDRVGEVTRVSPNVLWTHAAEWVGVIYEAASRRLPVEAAVPFVAEGEALLRAETLPGIPGPNPLRDRLDWVPVGEPDFPLGVQTRRYCCTTYVLPERDGLLCGNCDFLPLEERIALTREQRDELRADALELPAARRSAEYGRKKMRAGN
jgi:hypothetical protein